MSRHIRFNGRVRDLLEHITRRTRFLSLVSDLSFARVSFASFRTVTGELSTPSPQLPVASLSYLGAICTGEPVTDLISLFAPMLWFFFSLSFQAIATPATEHQLTQHQQRRGLGRDTCTTCLHVDSETTMMMPATAVIMNVSVSSPSSDLSHRRRITSFVSVVHANTKAINAPTSFPRSTTHIVRRLPAVVLVLLRVCCQSLFLPSDPSFVRAKTKQKT